MSQIKNLRCAGCFAIVLPLVAKRSSEKKEVDSKMTRREADFADEQNDSKRSAKGSALVEKVL